MSGKRYYWLKLKEDFFEDDTINWLEEQENGKDYVIFYLKLCLKSLSNDGYLIRYVGEKLLPYDVKALAKLTDTHADTVAVAMKTFIEIGLIERLDSGEIYLKQIDEMVGSETDAAIRKRRSRAKLQVEEQRNQIAHTERKELDDGQYCDNVTEQSQNVTQSKSKRKSKSKSIEKEPEEEDNSSINLHQFYQQNFGVETPYIVEDIEHWKNDLNDALVLMALEKAIEKGASYSYAKAIMKNWTAKNISTVEEANSENVQRQKQSNFSKKSFNQQRTETLPDWVTKEYEAPVDEEVSEEEKEKMQERLRKIREKKRGE